MTRLILFAFAVFFAANANSQWFTQSAEGKGSLIFKGTAISLDPVKADLSFSINNLVNPIKVSPQNDKQFLFFGSGLGIRNEEGLGSLFSGSKLVPSAHLNVYFGFKLTNSYNKLHKAEETRLSGQIARIKTQQQIEFNYKMRGKIDEEILSSPLTDSVVIKKIKKEWKEKLSKSTPRVFFEFLKTYKPDNVQVANIIPNLLTEIESINKANARELEHVRNLLAENSEENIRNKLWQFSVFTIGGMHASSFTRVENMNGNNVSGSIIKEDYTGGSFGIGINYQIEGWKIGATYAYRKSNNFHLLDKTEYKMTTGSGSTGQVFTQEMKGSGYSGDYGEVEINELNGDIIYTLDLGNNSNAYILLNGYYRGEFFSRNESLLPNSFNLGLGSYFFAKRSKFLGGFYAELVDAGNDYEKARAANITMGTSLRRLTFGIVLKLSLNSFLSQQ